MILSKKFFFKNSEESDISPQIIEFKNLEDSEVIFQALETSPALFTLAASVVVCQSAIILLSWGFIHFLSYVLNITKLDQKTRL